VIVANQRAQTLRIYLGGFFALILIVNVVIAVVAAIAEISHKEDLRIWPADFPPAGRLLVFVAGLLLSYFIARWLYRQMFHAEIPIGTATSTAHVFLFLILFAMIGLAFLGVLSWIWLAVLIFLIIVFAIVTVWSLLGGVSVVACILAAAVAGWLVFYLLG
jgi:hypothetical protein